ncbi:MAG TPA: pyruvate:ferredoxin (flavodoxin) oxidoreductase, partial [Mesotoga infera]|nr:pyruvate:ferredoxin (flavodoxin) oxidoreductase [Mesotoga infera]
FGKKPIKSTYLIDEADYVACHKQSYVYQYELLEGLKKGGTFVLNTSWDFEELDKNLPGGMKRYLAENEIEFYTIDATKIAMEIGLGTRINTIMQAAFFKLANVVPIKDAIKYLKDAIVKSYGAKGEKVVQMNYKAVDSGIEALKKIEIPESWKNAKDEKREEESGRPEFVKNIADVMNRQQGDKLPVSAFVGRENGEFPNGTSAYEKRGIAVMIPEWQIDNCTQCNQCSYVCPHAAIRPFLINDEEENKAPDSFETKKALGGKTFDGLKYRIQVSPLDCTGCGNCADICPSPKKALVMKPLETQIEREIPNWEFATTVSEKKDVMNVETLKGSQFSKPLLEFSGACAGCGETPYAKLVTQLFGDRMLIANATGCSSIWGASAPATPYCKNSEGKGPAWANSLFEDNAEYGFGMAMAINHGRSKLAEIMEELLRQDIPEDMKAPFEAWLEGKDDAKSSKAATLDILKVISKGCKNDRANALMKAIEERKDLLIKKSIWI